MNYALKNLSLIFFLTKTDMYKMTRLAFATPKFPLQLMLNPHAIPEDMFPSGSGQSESGLSRDQQKRLMKRWGVSRFSAAPTDRQAGWQPEEAALQNFWVIARLPLIAPSPNRASPPPLLFQPSVSVAAQANRAVRSQYNTEAKWEKLSASTSMKPFFGRFRSYAE